MSADEFPFQHITSQESLESFCSKIRSASMIGFDTEFVSEDRYRPQLCLVQVAADDEYAIIDPFEVNDLRPFWDVLTDTEAETIVHAAREEFLFLYRATGRRPNLLFDVQIAAALIGLEYPASYSNLVSEVLGQRLSKAETRTNWRTRPLSSRQLQYALSDVIHLRALREAIISKLDEYHRVEWYAEEINAWQDRLTAAEEREQWDRVSGISGFSRRKLAVVRELWRWRDQLARRTDQPPRRILRDDLICELAKRSTSDPKRIRAVRGMERVKRHIDDIGSVVQRALETPESDLPSERKTIHRNSYAVVGQFLNSVLSSVCRSAKVAPGIVGSSDAVKELIAYLLDKPAAGDPPALTQGWRGEIIGTTIEKVLSGELAIAVRDPRGDQPLEFIDHEPSKKQKKPRK